MGVAVEPMPPVTTNAHGSRIRTAGGQRSQNGMRLHVAEWSHHAL